MNRLVGVHPLLFACLLFLVKCVVCVCKKEKERERKRYEQIWFGNNSSIKKTIPEIGKM